MRHEQSARPGMSREPACHGDCCRRRRYHPIRDVLECLHSIEERLASIEYYMTHSHGCEYSDSSYSSDYSCDEYEYDPDYEPVDDSLSPTAEYSDSYSSSEHSEQEYSGENGPHSVSELEPSEYSSYSSASTEGYDDAGHDNHEEEDARQDNSYSYEYTIGSDGGSSDSGAVSSYSSEEPEVKKPAQAQKSSNKPAEQKGKEDKNVQESVKKSEETQGEKPSVTVVEGVRIVSIPPRAGVKITGEPAAVNSQISIRYRGTLGSNNAVFDQTGPRGQPLSFVIGRGKVIRGMEIGVTGMRIGERRTIVIPPKLAYGAAGAPPKIPPNECLHFNIERVK